MSVVLYIVHQKNGPAVCAHYCDRYFTKTGLFSSNSLVIEANILDGLIVFPPAGAESASMTEMRLQYGAGICHMYSSLLSLEPRNHNCLWHISVIA